MFQVFSNSNKLWSAGLFDLVHWGCCENCELRSAAEKNDALCFKCTESRSESETDHQVIADVLYCCVSPEKLNFYEIHSQIDHCQGSNLLICINNFL